MPWLSIHTLRVLKPPNSIIILLFLITRLKNKCTQPQVLITHAAVRSKSIPNIDTTIHLQLLLLVYAKEPYYSKGTPATGRWHNIRDYGIVVQD